LAGNLSLPLPGLHLELGFTERQAVLLIYLLTFGTGINATLLTQVGWGGALVILLSTMVIFSIIGILEFMGRKGRKNDNSSKTRSYPGKH